MKRILFSKRKTFIVFLIGFILTITDNSLNAQSITPCAADEILKQNPEIRKMLEKLEKEFQKKKGVNAVTPDMTTVYTIPVVFHVYHLGEAVGTGSNIPDSDIQSALAGLNQAFRATGSYAGNSPDVKIQFILASRTPDCQSTNGIVRVDGRSIANYQSNGLTPNDGNMIQALRNLSTWPTSQYVNIRIVHQLYVWGTQSGGFAYFLNDLFMPAPATNGYQSSFWAHEMGHSMNLYHTFEGDGGNQNCPVNNDPENDGDKISDTDPHKQNDGCDYTATNGCTGNPFGDVLKNIMSYSCSQKFTTKQVERMRYALVNYRTSLINSLGKTPPSGTLPTLACNVTAGNGLSDYFGINAFSMGDISYSGSSSNYNGANYQNLTCLSQSTFQAGNTYSFNLTSANGNPVYGKIFIDYNNDGDFEDVGENPYNSNNYLAGHTGNILISNSATINTNLRMRVMLDASEMTACNLPGSTYGSGSAVDFSITITPNTCTPPTPPSTLSTSRCGAGSVTLTASGCSGTYNWYSVSSGGSSLGTSSAYTTPSLIASTNYYVDCTVGSCISTRATSTATITQQPLSPSTSSTSRCGAGSVTLTASGCSGTYNWYSVSSGGSSLGTSSAYTTPSLTATTNYYVDCTVGACTSWRTTTPATITPIPAAPTVTSTSINSGQAATLSASGCSGTITWYNADTGGSSLGTGTSYTTPSLTISTTYYASCNVNVCEGSRGSGVVTINSSGCQPLMVASPSGANLGETFANWSWSASSVSSINLRYRPFGGNFWYNHNNITGGGAGNVALIPNTLYEFQTQTVCLNGSMADYTSSSYFRTLSCTATLTTSSVFIPTADYKVSQTLISTGNISTGTNFFAGNAVLLNPGFSAGGSETFTAQIKGCTQAPENGMVAYYPFNGNTNDESGSSNHATNNGATLTTDRFGKVNKAYNFGGTSSPANMQVNNSSSLQFTSSATFSLWFNLNSYAGQGGSGANAAYGIHTLFAKEADWSGLYGRVGGDLANDKMWVGLGNNSVYDFGAGDAYASLASNLSVWTHLVFVLNANTVKIYKNGVLTKTETLPNNIDFSASNANNLFFGRYGGGVWYPLNGKLDDIRIYNRSLSDAEVLQIFNAEKP